MVSHSNYKAALFCRGSDVTGFSISAARHRFSDVACPQSFCRVIGFASPPLETAKITPQTHLIRDLSSDRVQMMASYSAKQPTRQDEFSKTTTTSRTEKASEGLGDPADSHLDGACRLSGWSTNCHSFERLATSGSSCSGGSSAASGVGFAGSSGEAPGIGVGRGGGTLGHGSWHDPTGSMGV